MKKTICFQLSHERQTLLNEQTSARAVKLHDDLVQTQAKLKSTEQEFLLVKTQHANNQSEISKLTSLNRKYERIKLASQNKLENVEKAKKAVEVSVLHTA